MAKAKTQQTQDFDGESVKADMVGRIRATALEIGTLADAVIDMVRALDEPPMPPVDLMESDAWKRMPLHEILGPALATKVIDAFSPIMRGDTLGALVVLLKNRQMTDGRGIGRGTANKITDKLEQFWKAHPRFCPEPWMPGVAR